MTDTAALPWLIYVATALHVLFATAVAAACVAAHRWSTRRWAPLGVVVGMGLLVRAWAGLILFAVSYFNLPPLTSLQSGDGFWHLAPDARTYHELASASAAGKPIPFGSPSPWFLRVLALWMQAAGDSPASAILFNLALYAAICVMLIAAFRPLNDQVVRRGVLISISTFSFSPVLILLGTQSLKDVFSTFLVVLAALAVLSIVSQAPDSPFRRNAVLMVGCIAIAVFLMAGIRAYYALFMWAAVGGALATRILLMPRRAAVPWVPFAGGALVLLWCAFMWGAGPYYVYYGDLVTRTVGVHLPGISPRPEQVAALPRLEGFGVEAARSRVDSLRRGFVRSGGATNLFAHPDASGGNRLRALLLGLAAVFIPISVLLQFSLVQFSGGRGFLLVTDLDTIFINLALLAVGWVLLGSGAAIRRNLPFVCFALGLGLVSAVLMAYVVTNYGTLFRLRLLAVVPLWVLPLALRHAGALSVVPDAAEGESAGRSRTSGTRERGTLQSSGAA